MKSRGGTMEWSSSLLTMKSATAAWKRRASTASPLLSEPNERDSSSCEAEAAEAPPDDRSTSTTSWRTCLSTAEPRACADTARSSAGGVSSGTDRPASAAAASALLSLASGSAADAEEEAARAANRASGRERTTPPVLAASWSSCSTARVDASCSGNKCTETSRTNHVEFGQQLVRGLLVLVVQLGTNLQKAMQHVGELQLT